jgi:hypothetical protein
MLDARETGLAVFDGDAPPDVPILSTKLKFGIEQVTHALASFAEHLKDVPVCPVHDIRDSDDLCVRKVFMEEITHRIYKNHPWLTPVERLFQLVLNQPKFPCPVWVSSLKNSETLILRNAHSCTPECLPHGVAVLTALAAF